MLSSRLLQKAAFIKPNTTASIQIPRHLSYVTTNVSMLKKRNSYNMIRPFSSSEVNIPSPPTSIHPHHSIPNAKGSLIYTETDEAPALATFSLLPILTKVSILLLVITPS